MTGRRAKAVRTPPRVHAPMAWQTLHYLAAPVPYLTRAHHRYGDVFTARLLGQNWTVLADPAAIREVFATSPDYLQGGAPSRVLQPLIGTHNALMLDGDDYLYRRRMLLPAFHGHALHQHEATITRIAEQHISSWPTAAFPVLPRLQQLTAAIIKQCVLGDSGDAVAAAAIDLLHWLTHISRLTYYFTFGAERLMRLPGYQTQHQKIRDLMSREIELRRSPSHQQKTDILTILVNARDQEGKPLSDEDIRDETLTQLVAGHENTAATLAWAIHELARAPSTQRQLAADPETWLEPVISETLRLRPPVPLMPRRLTVPLTIAGYNMTAGTNIAPCALLAQRRLDRYHDPLRFHPQRFLSRQPEAPWHPFGGGVRRCMGEAFAQLELRIILQVLTSSYHIQPIGAPESARPRALVLIPNRRGLISLSKRATS